MRIYTLRKVNKFREYGYTLLFIIVSLMTGIGLGVVMLLIERILN